MSEKIELSHVEFSNNRRKIALNTGLEEGARNEVANQLKKNLADAYLLMLKTHYYHWNVKGTLFKSLHDLTEEQYTELFTAIDDLAERIRALGHEAPGSFSKYSEMSDVKDAESGLTDLEMTADLLESHEKIISRLRKTLDAAGNANDEVTVDMMVGRLSLHEKNAWMLRSFLER